jgi:hypothetical protein
VPGAKLEGQVEAPPPPNMTGAPAASPRPSGRAPAPGTQSTAIDRAWEQLRLAKQQHEDAKAKLESGREPLEGERTGTAKGGSRLNDRYWARQKANEEAVQQAEARVRQAQDSINRLR